jgi:nitrile hydratase accessory protein
VSGSGRPGPTEIGDARRRVQALVAGLPAGPGGELAFSQPWEIRAFAIAVAAYDSGQYEWSEFQLSLIESIRQWEQSGRDPDREPWNYYQHWLTALETVLAGSGLLSESQLDERTKSVLATPRDASHQAAHPEPVAVDPPVR